MSSVRRATVYSFFLVMVWVFSISAAPSPKSRDIAVPRTIQDQGNFFSKEVVSVANQEIAEIRKLFKKDVIIETVQKVPMTNEKALENPNQVDPAFSEWAKKRLTKTGTKNIYIVVSREPSYIMAAVGAETRTRGEFSEEDRNALIKLLADNFQQRDYNKGLIDSVRFIRATIDNNLHGRPAPRPPTVVSMDPKDDVTFLWRWIGFGCAGLLAVLLITGLIKGFGQTPVTSKPPEQQPTAV